MGRTCLTTGLDSDGQVVFAAIVRGITFFNGSTHKNDAPGGEGDAVGAGGLVRIQNAVSPIRFEDVVFRGGQAVVGGAVLVLDCSSKIVFGTGVWFDGNVTNEQAKYLEQRIRGRVRRCGPRYGIELRES